VAIGVSLRRLLLLGHVHEQYAHPERRNSAKGDQRTADRHIPSWMLSQTSMAMFVCTTGDAGRWFSAMFKKTKKM
jgi:hypothetical protein